VIERLIDEWRACQQRANELERQYAAAMMAYYRGEGPPPEDEMKARLSALRKEAKELLARALSEIDRIMVENARNVDKH
jgi:hypothetical protein